MGVRGLQSFLKDNPGLHENIKLSSTTLIIEAKRLFGYLFGATCFDKSSRKSISIQYGGNMVAFADEVRKFFKSLQDCNIKPILVFDGSINGGGKSEYRQELKHDVLYTRGLEKFRYAMTTSETKPEEFLSLPANLDLILKKIICELGLKMVQAPYKARNLIAQMANDYDCPVLTEDSDFIFHNLPKGFILIDLFNYANLKTHHDDRKYIECSIFSQDRLVSHFPGLNKDCLSLISVLTGTDYGSSLTFKRFLETAGRTRYNGLLKTHTFNHKRIASIWTWLSGKARDEAIRMALSQVHPDYQEKTRNMIDEVTNAYRSENVNDLLEELNKIYPGNDVTSGDSNSLHPANRLWELFGTTSLSPLISLDTVFHATFYHNLFIEDFDSMSSESINYRPYSVLITLLRCDSNANIAPCKYQVKSEREALQMYDRVDKDYCRVVIRSLEILDGFGSIEHLTCYNIFTLDSSVKESLLMATYRFDESELTFISNVVGRVFTGHFKQDIATCLLLIKYIGIETKTKPNAHFVDALLLTLYYYASSSGQVNQEAKKSPEDLMEFTLDNSSEVISNTEANLLYRNIMHSITQLWAAFGSFCLLNNLLSKVLDQPQLDRFFNGSLIFKFSKMLDLGCFRMAEACEEIPDLLDVSKIAKEFVGVE